MKLSPAALILAVLLPGAAPGQPAAVTLDVMVVHTSSAEGGVADDPRARKADRILGRQIKYSRSTGSPPSLKRSRTSSAEVSKRSRPMTSGLGMRDRTAFRIEGLGRRPLRSQAPNMAATELSRTV